MATSAQISARIQQLKLQGVPAPQAYQIAISEFGPPSDLVGGAPRPQQADPNEPAMAPGPGENEVSMAPNAPAPTNPNQAPLTPAGGIMPPGTPIPSDYRGRSSSSPQANPNEQAVAPTAPKGGPSGAQPPAEGQGVPQGAPAQASGPDASAQTGTVPQSGFQGAGNDNARTEQIYGLGAGEDPRQWADRVFMQSMADKGQSLYSDNNPFANTPWAQFVKNRYGTAMPMQALMGTLENPVGEGGVPAALRDSMRSAALGGGSPAGGIGGLQKVGDLMTRALGGDGGVDPMQAARLKDIANDPTTSATMILSQLQGATGGWGMRELTDRVRGLQQHYYNDPYNMDPGQSGSHVPFYNQALKLIGLS